MECEICGAQGAFRRVVVDGSELLVCSSCAHFGAEVKEEPTGLQRRPSHHEAAPASQEMDFVLADDYGKRLRLAREKAGLTMKELAAKIYEKESVLHKVEHGSFRPEDRLVRKLEKALNVKLTEEI